MSRRHQIQRTLASVAGAAQLAVGPVAAQSDLSPRYPLSASSAIEIGVGLAMVMVIIVLCAWAGRRVFRIAPGVSRHLKIVAGLPMGTRERIVLLQVGETQLLVAVSPGRMHTLHVLEKPLSLGEEKLSGGASFGGELLRFLKPRQGENEV